MAVKPAPAVEQLPIGNKRFALVIGVDNYADTQITTLGGASDDAWTGKFEDGVIRGTAQNTEGTEFKFLLTPKN